MISGSFKNVIYKMCLQIIYLIHIYKQDLVSNNLQWLIFKPVKLCLNIDLVSYPARVEGLVNMDML